MTRRCAVLRIRRRPHHRDQATWLVSWVVRGWWAFAPGGAITRHGRLSITCLSGLGGDRVDAGSSTGGEQHVEQCGDPLVRQRRPAGQFLPGPVPRCAGTTKTPESGPPTPPTNL